MTTWFTADWHLGHEAIMRHCKRPFDTVREMDAAIVGNFKRLVRPKDTVYFLGDFALRWEIAHEYWCLRSPLPGRWYWLRGNHDESWWNRFLRCPADSMKDWWDLRAIKVDGQRIVLCHYPLVSWRGSTKGSWHLHGHCHRDLPATTKLRIDVGVDAMDFRPISLEHIAERMAHKAPHDHHGGVGAWELT